MIAGIIRKQKSLLRRAGFFAFVLSEAKHPAFAFCFCLCHPEQGAAGAQAKDPRLLFHQCYHFPTMSPSKTAPAKKQSAPKKKTAPAKSPTAQLDAFLEKFTPEVAAQARTALRKMRARLPGATELVYDNYNALAIGFAPSERACDAIFSIALYPKWVSLFFLLNGTRLRDPEGLLAGSGNVVRHIVLGTPALLDTPAVQDLIGQALELSPKQIDPNQQRKLVIKSVSAKQRPRRPGRS